MPNESMYTRIYRMLDFLDAKFDDFDNDRKKVFEEGLIKIITDLDLKEEFEAGERRAPN